MPMKNVENGDFQNINKWLSIQDVRENNRITIRELFEGCRISYCSVQFILTEDLGMRRAIAKFLPKLLSADQKEDQLSAALNLLECADNEENF
ncbi:hypothetical protein AVEN_270597-1 [Araneus ventricosus]|uniref:Uncharacterized protein n=1 Tax=Araneus ventricosus TaxID=182803 RepID=A0A4Y2DIE2_ARAVE|nr:hypothetical protein AVEN_270597-1 [Araneus ventricosus]